MISIPELKTMLSENNLAVLEYLRKSRTDSESETVEQVLAKHEGIISDYMRNTFEVTIPDADIYREVVSGETIDDREEIRKMFARVETGNIFAVVVIEPQRLTRGDLVDLGTVERIFKYTNTIIICPNKIYDLNDQFDLKLFRMELQQGSEYLEYVKMILARGRMRSVEEGKFVTSIAPTGYDKIKLDKGFSLVPNSEADTMRDLFEYYIRTGNLYATSQWLSSRLGRQVKPFTCKTFLKNKVYAGYITYGQVRNVRQVEDGKLITKRKRFKEYKEFKGIHEPLISLETYEKVQQLLKRCTPKVPVKFKLQNPLAGIMVCAKCGNKMQRRRGRVGEYAIYCPNASCRCVASSIDIVEERVFTALAEELKEENRYIENYDQEIIKKADTGKKEVARLNKEIDKLQIKLDRIMDAYESGAYEKDVFILRSNYIKEQINSLISKIKAFQQDAESNDVEIIRKRIPNLEKCLQSYNILTPQERNELLKLIIEKITYDKDVRGDSNTGRGCDAFTLRITFVS